MKARVQHRAQNGARPHTGFTMVEMVLAISILGIITLLVFYTFDVAVSSWRAGTEFSERINHADFVMDQLVMGLRSAYYPDAGRIVPEYGLQLFDDGNDENALDTLAWTKIGSSLVGADAPYAGVPHRIELGVMEEKGRRSSDTVKGLAYRAWRQDLNPEDFDPEDVEPVFISPQVIGFNCRMLDPAQAKFDVDKSIDLEWLDVWEGDHSNRIPYVVEVTLYLDNPENEKTRRSSKSEPLAVRRIVQLPMADLSWNPRSSGGRSGGGSGGGSSGGGGGGGISGGGGGSSGSGGDGGSGGSPQRRRPAIGGRGATL